MKGLRFKLEDFRCPDSFYWPAYIWTWNDRIIPRTLRCQLKDMQERGAKSVWQFAWPNCRPQTMPSTMRPDYPVVVAPLTPADGRDDYFLSSRLGGTANYNPVANPNFGIRDQYPGPWMCAQLQLFYNDTAGLYMATYDSNGCVKHFGAKRLNGDGLDLSIEHNYDERPGLSFALPYDTVLGVFHGSWHEAADMYKAWAVNQPWCSKRLSERVDVPAWLKEGRPVMMFMPAGNPTFLWQNHIPISSELPNSRYLPMSKLSPLFKKYASILRTPVIPQLQGWEQFGVGSGPAGVFPPKGGEPGLKAAISKLNKDENYPLIFFSGIHWGYRRPFAGFDGRTLFQKKGVKLAALNDAGKPNGVKGSWKEFAHLCVASEKVKDIFLKHIRKFLEFGTHAIQYDLFHGGAAQVTCYSEKHGHRPGYGLWMYEEGRKFLRRSRQEGKKKDPRFMLSIETPCETVIQEIGLSHPEQELIKIARCLVDGNAFIACIDKLEFDPEVKPLSPSLELLRNTCRAMRTFANDYVVLGQMLKPSPLKTATTTVDRMLGVPGWSKWAEPRYSNEFVAVPRVLHSLWKSPSGKIGYVLVNWTGSPEKVTLALVQAGGKGVLFSGRNKKRLSEKEMKSGLINTTVLARSVALVEQTIEQGTVS